MQRADVEKVACKSEDQESAICDCLSAEVELGRWVQVEVEVEVAGSPCRAKFSHVHGKAPTNCCYSMSFFSVTTTFEVSAAREH